MGSSDILDNLLYDLSNKLNQKVISISNGYQSDPNDISLKIGEVVGINSFPPKAYFPSIKFDGDNKTYISMAIIVSYSEEIYNILLKLTPKERYQFCTAIIQRFQ